MALELKRAQRKKAYLRLGLAAPSGGGKTLGALLVAYGLMKEKYPDKKDVELWDKIAIVDTENGSGELYVGMEVAGESNIKIGEYNAITLHAPFEAEKYISAIQLCEDNGIEVCILDSTSHLWSGEGGLLEQQGNVAKRVGNSYTAWREITPLHNKFVEKMLQSQLHIIATMRSKQEYVQEKDDKTSKTVVRKLGLEPEQRKGMEYEFTTFLDIDSDHTAFGSKDRTNMFDNKYFKLTPKVGQQMMNWLESGTSAEDVIVATQHKADPLASKDTVKASIIQYCKDLGGSQNEELMKLLKTYTPNGNPNSINDMEKLGELHSELESMLAKNKE